MGSEANARNLIVNKIVNFREADLKVAPGPQASHMLYGNLEIWQGCLRTWTRIIEEQHGVLAVKHCTVRYCGPKSTALCFTSDGEVVFIQKHKVGECPYCCYSSEPLEG